MEASTSRSEVLLPARADIPRIVVEVNSDIVFVELAHNVAHAFQSAGHVAVKIELIPLVHSDAWIGVPNITLS